MLLKSLLLQNFLSFGPTNQAMELSQLNVLIGPNGAGKSNFLEAMALLQAAPHVVSEPFRHRGVGEWLWKAPGMGPQDVTARVEAVIGSPLGQHKENLRHVIEFSGSGGRFRLEDERIENERAYPGKVEALFFYKFQKGNPVISVRNQEKRLQRESVDEDLSILAQRKDPDTYPVITQLARQYLSIRIYREWAFGRANLLRSPQAIEGDMKTIQENGRNLGVFLNNLDPVTKKTIVGYLKLFYEGIDDYKVQVSTDGVSLGLVESDRFIPASRLSDGTLRFLFLVTILCQPDPPPLICIEEPEMGLHPDMMPTCAKLLREASERTQVLITTHSAQLVDALSDAPDSVIVCEREEDGTTMKRLDANVLKPWMEKYKLGQLWERGDLGGTRW